MRVVGISVLQGRRQSVSRTLAFLAGTCLVGQGGEVCWVNFFPDMSGALTASPPLLHRFNALVVLGYLVKILRGRDLDVKFKAKFDLGVINGRV